MSDQSRDRWATWLLERRHGGDPEQHRRVLDRVGRIRDRVLDQAKIETGNTVLDVGTGDGLIAFGALERVGGNGTAIFSDISADLLDHGRALATEMGVLDRCRFIQAHADDLAGIADESVDVVTTRSVLAYVPDKARALREFARVLRGGGRISLYEPINRHCYPEPVDQLDGYDVAAVQAEADKIKAFLANAEPAHPNPMIDFDERDLLRHAERAGFDERHLELRLDIAPHQPSDWTTFLRAAPNPLTPTLEQAMTTALIPEERARFTVHLRPLVERGDGTFAVAVAYLWGTKRQ